MRIIGLTGSIGMGKTTTAAMFRARGVPVHDADRTVHRLYAGPAVAEIEQVFPGTTEDGAVDRGRLAEHVTGRPDALRRLEAIVHPMVREVEAEFLRRARQESRRAVVLDVPLLLETESVGRVDTIVVVSAGIEIQRERVLSRPGMTEDKFEALLARQLPDQEKRRRAHFVIDTGRGLDHADRQVEHLLRALAFAT